MAELQKRKIRHYRRVSRGPQREPRVWRDGEFRQARCRIPGVQVVWKETL